MAQNSLPRFAGNYGERTLPTPPQIDKTGDYALQSMNNMTNMVLKSIQAQNAEAARAKLWIDKNYKYGEEQKDKMIYNIKTQGIHNKSFFDIGMNLLDTKTKLREELHKAVGRDAKNAVNDQLNMVSSKLNEYMQLSKSIGDSSANVIGSGRQEGKWGKAGRQATTGSPYTPIYNAGIDGAIGFGDLGDDGGARYYWDEDGSLRMEIRSENIKGRAKEINSLGLQISSGPGGRYSGISKRNEIEAKAYVGDHLDVNAQEFWNFEPGEVPDLGKEIKDSMILKEILDGNGQVNDSYVNQRIDTKIDANGKSWDHTIQITDMSKINGINNAGNQAKMKSYLAQPNQAQIIYKQIFNKNDDLNFADGTQQSSSLSVFDKESEENFGVAWDEYTRSLIPQEQTIKIEETDIPETATLTAQQELALKEKEQATKVATKDAKDLVNTILSGDERKIAALFQGKKLNGKEVRGVDLRNTFGPSENAIETNPQQELFVNFIEGKSTEKGNLTFHESPVDSPPYNLGSVDNVETIIDWFIKAGNYGSDKNRAQMMEIAKKQIRNKLNAPNLPD